MDNLSLSLQITVIGMGLVFGAIVLLWIMMAVLVRLTPDKAEEPAAEDSPIEPQTTDQAPDQRAQKRRAAIAAVAVALAHEATPKIHEFPLPATPIVSAWQAVQRGRQLSQHGPRQK